MRCQCCENEATVHLNERVAGQWTESHYCEPCSWERQGLAFPATVVDGQPVVVKARDGRRHLTQSAGG